MLLNRPRILLTIISTFCVFNLVLQWVWGEWSASFLGFELIFLLLTSLLPIVATAFYKWFVELSQEVDKAFVTKGRSWLRQQAERLFNLRLLLVPGCILTIVGVYSTYVYWVPWTGWIRALFYAVCMIFFFGYGIFGYVFVALATLMIKIGRLELATGMFRWPVTHLHRIYDIYFRFLALGSGLYLLAVLAVWVSPGGRSIALQTGLGRLWVFPPALFIIVFFVIFHYVIHVQLRNCKWGADEQLSVKAEDAYNQLCEQWSTERESAVTALLSWREHVRSTSEWPGSVRLVATTIGTVLLPTITVVVDLLK